MAAFEAGDLDLDRRRRRSTRRGSPTTRRSGRSPRRSDALSLSVLRLRHVAAAVRRRPGPPGVRPGGRLAAARSSLSRGRPRAGRRPAMVPPGIPGRSDDRLPARPRSGRRPGAPRRAPAIRADAASRRPRSSAAAAGIARSRPRSSASSASRSTSRSRVTASSTGSRTIRRRSSRWAGSPTTRARTTSSGSSSAPGRRTTTAAGRRAAFDGAIDEALAARRSGGRAAAFDTARGIVRDEAPVIPLVVRRRLVAGADRPPRRLSETGSGSSGWRGSRGPLNDIRRRGPPPSRSFAAVAAARRVDAGRVARSSPPTPSTFGYASASSTFGDGVDFRQPVTLPAGVQRGRRSSSRRPGAIGPTVQPVEVRRPATLDPPYQPRRCATAASSRTRRSPASGGSSDATARRGSDRRSRHTLCRRPLSTGRRWKGTWSGSTGCRATRRSASGALKIGDDAVRPARDPARRDGVRRRSTSSSTPTRSEFYDALGPGTRENVGGEAHPDIRTLFALITPDEIDASWVEASSRTS